MNIKTYLDSKYKAATASSYYKEWLAFKSYLEKEQIPINALIHDTIISYVEDLQSKGLQGHSINRKLAIIEQVYKALPLPKVNPVRGFRVQGQHKKALLAPLDYKQLSQYLSEFKASTAIQKRNRLILSLIHHQALKTSEIKALKLEHVKLKQAQIFIPSVLRSKARTLNLTALQVVWMSEYLAKNRLELPNPNRSNLFLSSGGSAQLTNSLLKLQKLVKKGLVSLQNLAHWRSSVIVYLLENNSLLAVQSKLGHRYASSTERYQIYAIKSLQESLKQHRPLN
ncbi:MAG: tyrosine-type recombinase/integrase [Saprospiraceae bacterium]|nr:tyrosine-type recombinase/integrase [Saprospiraceae bacterium]